MFLVRLGPLGMDTLSGFRKRVVSKRVGLADLPWTPKTGARVQKTERRYDNRNDGTKRTGRHQKPERGQIRQTAPLFRTKKNNLVSVELFARNAGAGNGCINLMGAWKICVLSAVNVHAHKLPRFRGVRTRLGTCTGVLQEGLRAFSTGI